MTPAPATKAISLRLRRSGFTLFEILLVLALLVVIAAVMMPVISDSLSQARLENSGELVRAAWGKARLAAMQARRAVCVSLRAQGAAATRLCCSRRSPAKTRTR